jgi:hypothetical protein
MAPEGRLMAEKDQSSLWRATPRQAVHDPQMTIHGSYVLYCFEPSALSFDLSPINCELSAMSFYASIFSGSSFISVSTKDSLTFHLYPQLCKEFIDNEGKKDYIVVY